MKNRSGDHEECETEKRHDHADTAPRRIEIALAEVIVVRLGYLPWSCPLHTEELEAMRSRTFEYISTNKND
jgi:hypothetical protein